MAEYLNWAFLKLDSPSFPGGNRNRDLPGVIRASRSHRPKVGYTLHHPQVRGNFCSSRMGKGSHERLLRGLSEGPEALAGTV